MKALPRLLCVPGILLLASSAFAAGEWTPLFNGKDTTGWKVVGEAKAEVVDGALVGAQKSTKGGNILTTAEYGNSANGGTARIYYHQTDDMHPCYLVSPLRSRQRRPQAPHLKSKFLAAIVSL